MLPRLRSTPKECSWEGSIIFTQVAQRLGGMPLFRDVVLKRTANFDNAAYVKTSGAIQTLVKDGAFNSDFASESDPYAETLFESGKAAMWDMGDWDVATLWPVMHNNLGWFPFPSIPGGKGNGSEVGNIFNADAISSSPTDRRRQRRFPRTSSSTCSPHSAKPPSCTLAYCRPLTSHNRRREQPGSGQRPNAAASSTSQMSAWDDALGIALGENFDDATANILGGQSPAGSLAEVDKFAKELG